MSERPPPPETVLPSASPATILEWFERVREQYRMGVLNAAVFNQLLTMFQFPDDAGTLWTPGARSSQWYRWDGSRWIPGDPPARLQVPPMDLAASDLPPLPTEAPGAVAAPKDPNLKVCPKCGAENVGKKFCTKCGSKLV